MEDKKPQTEEYYINSLPPNYDCIVQTLPPPTYLQSARLHYKNQPYISEYDELIYRQQQERQYVDDQSDTWSDISKLPLRKRFKYYVRSWGNTIYDGRLIFFAFFVFTSLGIFAVVLSVIAIPSLLNR
ncbi:hypothetical protein INT47_010205 [Mucor saturninus]|uniref:Uncharacterized protein n=1 Tax=Mucor saturninus TaxID=64648 RepID=A0A8H7VBN5_9FUNG|nr:hypothetical protein INT47_010205 [Mucor saturninus]